MERIRQAILLAYRLSCPGYEARLTCYMTRLAFGWRREQDEVCWEITGTTRKMAKQTFAVIFLDAIELLRHGRKAAFKRGILQEDR
jgi:hypothetical protein